MPINDVDNVNHRETARILGTALWAGLRRGHLTEGQEAKIERIIRRADIREDEKREIRRAAKQAADRARFEARKKKAVDKAVDRATRRSWF